MKSLNRRFRGKDKPTDVLSFSADPDGQKQLAGEIAISAEQMARREKQLRAKLHLPLGLTERATTERATIDKTAPRNRRNQPQ